MTDPYHFFDEKMATGLSLAGIRRFGTPGDYHYEVRALDKSDASMPFLSWNDATHYCEWRNHSENSSFSLQSSALSLSCASTGADPDLKSNILFFELISSVVATEASSNTSDTFNEVGLFVGSAVIVGGGMAMYKMHNDHQAELQRLSGEHQLALKRCVNEHNSKFQELSKKNYELLDSWSENEYKWSEEFREKLLKNFQGLMNSCQTEEYDSKKEEK